MQHEAHSGTNWMRILCVCKCVCVCECECVNDCLSDPEAAAHLPRQSPWALGNLIAFEEPKPEPEKPLSLSAPFHVSIRATHTHTDRDSIIWGSHNVQSVKSVGPNTRQGHVRENLKTHTDRQRDGHDVCLSVWQGGGDQRSLAGLHFVAYQVVKCCTWLIPYTALADCAHFLDLSLVDAGHRHPLLSGVISPKNVRNHCAYDKLFLP